MARIYLAGAESIELLTSLLQNGTEDVMLSFYYIQKRGALPQILSLFKQYPQTRVFMDSGAVTFAKKDRGDPQTYWKAYYDFLRQHGHRFEYASEFDIDGYQWQRKGKTITVSEEQIDSWREDLAELETVTIVPVWHQSRGREAWERYCKDTRYPHVAMSRGNEILRGEGSKLIAQAHAWNTTVHGYVSEILTDLKFLKFDTIASTTWLVGQKFGDICIFQRGVYSRIYAGEGKKKRGGYARYFKSLGCDPAKILADDRMEINKANILAWNLLSKRLQLTHRAGPAKKSPSVPSVKEKPVKPQSVSPSPTHTPDAKLIDSAASQTHPVRIPQVLPPEQPQTALAARPVDSLTVEREQEDAIQLQQHAKPFIPAGVPELRCGICAMGPDCPKFDPEAVTCAFKAQFQLVRTGDVQDVLEELASIFAVNVERGRFMRLAEQLRTGGDASMEVSKHLDMTFSQGKQLAELMKGKQKSKTALQGAGLLGRLFGDLKTPETPVVIAGGDETRHELPPEEDVDALLEKHDMSERQQRQLENAR